MYFYIEMYTIGFFGKARLPESTDFPDGNFLSIKTLISILLQRLLQWVISQNFKFEKMYQKHTENRPIYYQIIENSDKFSFSKNSNKKRSIIDGYKTSSFLLH